MSYAPSVRIEWASEDVACIGTRSQRYPDALDIEVGWAQEVVADPQLVQVTPYPRSRTSVVIAYQDLDGDWHGMNAWPASGRDLAAYFEEAADE